MASFLHAEIDCSTSEAATWRSLGRVVNELEGVGEARMAGRIVMRACRLRRGIRPLN